MKTHLTCATLALAAALCGCAEEDGEPIAACYSGTDATAICIEQPLVGADDYAYAMSTCASASGQMRKRCPTENLVGVCNRTAKVASAAGFVPRDLRVFQYRHPDLKDERAEKALAERCADGKWMSAEALHVEE